MKVKSYFGVVLLFALFFGAVACTTDEKSAETEVEKNLGNLRSDLDENGRYSVTEDLENEGVRLKMSYSTDYDIKSWRITDSKTLKFTVALLKGPETANVYIEHVHVDVNIQASKAALDGLPQDSMDDSLHSGDQPGFLITTAYPYEEVFSIEGYSKTLIDGWGFVSGAYGQSDLSEKRLTEGNLRNAGGAHSNKFTFIYDVVIGTTETGFHKRIIVQEFKVPLS